MRTFLTKAEAIAQAKKWIDKQGTPPAANSWMSASSVCLHYSGEDGYEDLPMALEEVHCLEPDAGGNGGVIIVNSDEDFGQAIAITYFSWSFKAFLWDSRKEE